ncbi:RagB/SusD family nutrient uptake outer membrane protein [Sphingobacterium griseoflavum]|nr:RagB/SusD family nutrient uptake outer membrane protein [Sphingobacterium griseoflavum]
MKNIHNTKISAGILLVLVSILSSCEKWLDIKPQTEIESDVVFESEAGFQDALTGVYISLQDSILYGQELTYGLVDVLSGQYKPFTQSQNYYGASTYNYSEEQFINTSAQIFSKMYNAIANLNNLIGNINQRGQSLFSGSNYHVIRGEAYGLRAMVHFDLARLYASSMLAEGATKRAIPYMDTTGIVVKPRLTTTQLLAHVIEDLLVAENELLQGDPIVPGNEGYATTYLRSRNYKFNYFAVKALQARVYLYAGDKEKALLAARSVIESGLFPWTSAGEIATATETSRNKIFTQELIFELAATRLGLRANTRFDPDSPGSLLEFSSEFTNLFNVDLDYRARYVAQNILGTARYYSIKLTQPEGAFGGFTNRMPILRKSEMYYIAAECLAETQPSAAVDYLNEVRANRNIEALSSTLTAAQIQNELALEYRREFFSEGQVFYFFKRKNITAIPGLAIPMSESTYVLPLPDNELIYGQ